MPASRSQIIQVRADEVSSDADDFRQRLSLIDTGADSYLRRDSQDMSNLARWSAKITTAGPDCHR